MELRIIPRAEWGAKHAAGCTRAPLPVSYTYLHHSVTMAPDLLPPWDDDYAAVRRLEQIGQDRFACGISYTWVVTPAGLIFEGHGVDRQGTHTGGMNDSARAVVVVGDYRQRRLTEAQVVAIAWLLQHAAERRWVASARLTGGHRDAPGAQTQCPGDAAMADLPRINQLAAGPPISATEGFLMSLTQSEQQFVLTAARRTMGMMRQRYYVLRNGRPVEVGPGEPGAIPCSVLDSLDGAYLVDVIVQQAAAVIAATRGDSPEVVADLIAARTGATVASVVQTTMLPAVAEVVRESLGADNADLADAIVTEIGRRVADS